MKKLNLYRKLQILTIFFLFLSISFIVIAGNNFKTDQPFLTQLINMHFFHLALFSIAQSWILRYLNETIVIFDVWRNEDTTFNTKQYENSLKAGYKHRKSIKRYKIYILIAFLTQIVMLCFVTYGIITTKHYITFHSTLVFICTLIMKYFLRKNLSNLKENYKLSGYPEPPKIP